jgi:hypothetical protein
VGGGRTEIGEWNRCGKVEKGGGERLGKLYSLMISLTGGTFSPAPNARRYNDGNSSLVCSMLAHT